MFCGPSMVFTNVMNPRSHVIRKDEYRTTLVRRGASLGANSTVVCGTTIGRYAFIGAGSVVTRDVPDYALVFGNPARLRGWMCACGIKLEFSAERRRTAHRCAACGCELHEVVESRLRWRANRGEEQDEHSERTTDSVVGPDRRNTGRFATKCWRRSYAVVDSQKFILGEDVKKLEAGDRCLLRHEVCHRVRFRLGCADAGADGAGCAVRAMRC